MINVQYNYSNITSYNISIPKSDNSAKTVEEQLKANEVSQKISNLNYLSIGLKYSTDDVEILQIKVSNSLYNWTFAPDRIVDKDDIYYGKNSLLIPNNIIRDNRFDISIYYNDGSIYNTEINTAANTVSPLNISVSCYDKYLLINLNPNERIKDLDIQKAIKFDSIDDTNEPNYIIRIFKGDKLTHEKEVSLKSSVKLIESNYFKDADKIIIEKKINNNIISGNLYYLFHN